MTKTTAVLLAATLALAGCEKEQPQVAHVASVASCVEHSCRVITQDGVNVTVLGATAPGDMIVHYRHWDYWMVRP